MTTSPISHTHKWNITSRLELLLAKIAGHDVDLGTMTPPVATNLTEELLLEIADRLDNSGGGSDISSMRQIFLSPSVDLEDVAAGKVVELNSSMPTKDMWDFFVNMIPHSDGADGRILAEEAVPNKDASALVVFDGHAFMARHDVVASSLYDAIYDYLDNKWHFSKSGETPDIFQIGSIGYVGLGINDVCARFINIVIAREKTGANRLCVCAIYNSMGLGHTPDDSSM